MGDLESYESLKDVTKSLRDERPNVQPDQAFVLTRDCRVAMVTFGGKQVWTMKAGEKMLYDIQVERNDSFTVVQSGLNYYVLETGALGLS